jgi:hypothetical protein
VIDGPDPFAAKPDARLIRLLLRARRFNATLAQGEGAPFAALAEREGVSRSYFTRLLRLSYLAPDITQAILDGRQPSDLTAEKASAAEYTGPPPGGSPIEGLLSHLGPSVRVRDRHDLFRLFAYCD